MTNPVADRIATIGNHFRDDTRSHQLTVLHEDGPYLHLRYSQPGCWIDQFDVTTWPSHLAVSGDRGFWAFEGRIPDVLQVFRTQLTPYHWSTRVVAGPVWEFSPDRFSAWVAEQLDCSKDTDPGLGWDSIEREVANSVLTAAIDTPTGIEALEEWNDQSQRSGFRFDLEDLDPRAWDDLQSGFIWVCHGVHTVVRLYTERQGDDR